MSSLLDNICSMFHGIEKYHDTRTREHEGRTGNLMYILGEAYGLDISVCTELKQIGSLHDIGKIAIPQEILDKPEPLTKFERKVIELHPTIGYDFIKNIEHPQAKLAGIIILTHHENHDGSGYPKGLVGNEIPIEGSICAICDVYDALREYRPYRDKMSHESILKLMCDPGPNGLYNKFNPELMEIFKDISNEFNSIY